MSNENFDQTQYNEAQPQPLRYRPAVILPDGTRSIQLGSGTINALLGIGGMANIYKIWNANMEVSRAVKLMHPNLSDDSRRHFQTEMKIMASLSHPNIIEIHSVGVWNELPYIEMEFIDGATLSQFIKERGALPVPVCVAIAIFTGRALSYAHGREYLIYGQTYNGIIHRDIKPSNIMLSKDGVVKLMDFGIARPVEASLLTTDGSIMGTMQYLAPEQLDGKRADIASDIYAFGTVMYEMLTGFKAFPQLSITKLMSCKVKNDYRPLNTYNFRIPLTLVKLVHRCMTFDKRKRPPSVESVLAQLEKIHYGLTVDSPEQVIRQYLAMAAGTKTVLKMRRRVPTSVVLSVSITAAVIATAVASFIIIKRHKPQVIVKTERVEVIKEAPPRPAHAAAPSSGQKAATPAIRPPPPEPQKSLLEKLQARYGISDGAEIVRREVNNGEFNDARLVFQQLPADQKQTKKAAIFYARALASQGATDAWRQFVATQTAPDAELLIAKAKIAIESGRTQEALDLLDKCVSTPADFLPAADVRREYLYLRARCKSRLFDAAPSMDGIAAAMDAWFEVRQALAGQRDHAYFRIATDEMQKLAKEKEKY